MTNPETDKLLRLQAFVGNESIELLKSSFVTIVGLGAVGSYATEALARSGIGHLRIVDFDKVGPSNFNRQLYALNSTLGQAKTEVAKQRILDIQEGCQIEALNIFAHEDTLDEILAGSPDLVIDAIDSLAPKVALLAGCQQRQQPVISSMGAALRRDPSKIRTDIIENTHNCSLARFVRKRLRRLKIALDIPCVYSIESPENTPPQAIGVETTNECGNQRGRSRRPLGSFPTLTGIFGLTLAHMAIERLLDNPFTKE